jgi:hypothetical protein
MEQAPGGDGMIDWIWDNVELEDEVSPMGFNDTFESDYGSED